MANSDSPISHAVKEAVKQSNESLLLVGSLSPIALKILEVIKAGGTARDAAKQCQCSKQNVSYWIKRLRKAGLIRLQTRDVFKVYSLTPSGQTIFTGSDSNGEVVVLEDNAVKFRVIESLKKWDCGSCLEKKEKCSMPRTGFADYCTVVWKKLGDPHNWEKMGLKIGSVSVELHTGLGASHTEANVIIHPGKFVGYKPDPMLVDSGMAVQKCKDILEVQFQMLLSDKGALLHEPIFRFYSEEAKEDVTHGTVVIEGVGTVDNSPPEHIPHEEYSGVERTKARILLPDAVKALRNEVSDLKIQHSESFQDLRNKVNALNDKNAELISVNAELVSTNISTVQEIKMLSSQVKSLLEVLQGVTQQKPKGPEVTVASTQNVELPRIYQ